jgi:hypothetical protein
MSVTHTVNGKEYEIRTRLTEIGFEVRVYLGEESVSGVYSVTYETAADFQRAWGKNGADKLIEYAKSDLDKGIIECPLDTNGPVG